METKEQLLKKVREIEEAEASKARDDEKNRNYKKFTERGEDWVIGKAHGDIGVTKIDYDWYTNRFFTIGNAISIHGNCGTAYNAKAQITSATHTYFHNVWTDAQRRNFQNKLNKVALREITKIMGSLHCKLEILRLQSTSFFLDNLYPKDKVKEVANEIWGETVKLLDSYKDKDFKDFAPKEGNRIDLSHSKGILLKYLKEKRPHLLKLYEKDV